MDSLYPHAQNGKLPIASGIYKITCISNGKIYIGSTGNLHKRHAHHLKALRKNKHDNPHLQFAFNKYGEDAFIFEILELVLIPEMLTVREQHWFDTLQPFEERGFNLLRKAGSPLGWKHTPETRAKLSRALLGQKHTPEHIENNKQAQTGKKMSSRSSEKKRQSMLGNKHGLGIKHTPQARMNMSQARIGNKNTLGYHHTSEARAKMSEARLGKKHAPEAIEKMKQAQKGKIVSSETRAKLSEARRGKPAPNRGKKRTPEQIENMRQARWGKKEGRNER